MNIVKKCSNFFSKHTKIVFTFISIAISFSIVFVFKFDIFNFKKEINVYVNGETNNISIYNEEVNTNINTGEKNTSIHADKETDSFDITKQMNTQENEEFDPIYNKACSYYEKGIKEKSKEKAVDWLEKAVKKYKEYNEKAGNYKGYFGLGLTYYDLGKLQFCENHYINSAMAFEQAIKYKPCYDSYYYCALAYFETAKFRKANNLIGCIDANKKAVEYFNRANEFKQAFESYNYCGQALYEMALKTAEEEEKVNYFYNSIDTLKKAHEKSKYEYIPVFLIANGYFEILKTIQNDIDDNEKLELLDNSEEFALKAKAINNRKEVNQLLEEIEKYRSQL